MRVDRIILLLLGFIGVEKYQAAPGVRLTNNSTCAETKLKWIFVLRPEANEMNILTDLVRSTKSAVVKKHENDDDDVLVIVGPDDFQIFKDKTESLKIYKSHDRRCIDLPMEVLPIGGPEKCFSFTKNSIKSTIATTNLDSRSGATIVNYVEKDRQLSNRLSAKWRSNSVNRSSIPAAIVTSGITKRLKIPHEKKTGEQVTSESKKFVRMDRGKTRMKNYRNNSLNYFTIGEIDKRGGATKKPSTPTDNKIGKTSESMKKKETNSTSEIPFPSIEASPTTAFMNKTEEESANLIKRSLNVKAERNRTQYSTVDRAKSLMLRKTRKFGPMTDFTKSRLHKSLRKLSRRHKFITESGTTEKFTSTVDPSVRKLSAVLRNYRNDKRDCAPGVKCRTKRIRTRKRDDSNGSIKNFGPFKSFGGQLLKITNSCGKNGEGSVSITLSNPSAQGTSSENSNEVPSGPPAEDSDESLYDEMPDNPEDWDSAGKPKKLIDSSEIPGLESLGTEFDPFWTENEGGNLGNEQISTDDSVRLKEKTGKLPSAKGLDDSRLHDKFSGSEIPGRAPWNPSSTQNMDHRQSLPEFQEPEVPPPKSTEEHEGFDYEDDDDEEEYNSAAEDSSLDSCTSCPLETDSEVNRHVEVNVNYEYDNDEIDNDREKDDADGDDEIMNFTDDNDNQKYGG